MDEDESKNAEPASEEKSNGLVETENDVTKDEVVIETEGRLSVKRRIGLLGGVSFIMGSIIGSGIFVSPKAALQYTGSVGICLIVWAMCGLLTFSFSLIYGHLGILLPKSGGDYTFIREGIGQVPAFLVIWIKAIAQYPGSSALLSLVFAEYLCAPIFGKCGAPVGLKKTIAATEIVAIGIVNVTSVRLAASIQILFSAIKICALVIICVGGIVYLGEGKDASLSTGFEDSNYDVTSISLAVYSCFFAYHGYTAANDIAEEIINPRRNIPLALMISLVGVTAIYIITNVSYFSILSKDEFLTSSAVAFTWGETVLGAGAVVLPLSVMCSVFGTGNGGFFTDARQKFAAARAGHLPEVFSFIHYKSRIPALSVCLTTVVSLIMLIPSDVGQLLNMLGFVNFLIQSLTIIAYIRIRYKANEKNPSFRVPWVVPVIALLICIFMLVAPFLKAPKVEFLYGLGIAASGILFYFPFVHFKMKLPGTDAVTTFFQLLFQFCPTVLETEIKIN